MPWSVLGYDCSVISKMCPRSWRFVQKLVRVVVIQDLVQELGMIIDLKRSSAILLECDLEDRPIFFGWVTSNIRPRCRFIWYCKTLPRFWLFNWLRRCAKDLDLISDFEDTSNVVVGGLMILIFHPRSSQALSFWWSVQDRASSNDLEIPSKNLEGYSSFRSFEDHYRTYDFDDSSRILLEHVSRTSVLYIGWLQYWKTRPKY